MCSEISTKRDSFSIAGKDYTSRLLVGTGELVVEKSDTETTVPPEEMEKFIADINRVAPGINLSKENVMRVYPGILPATEKGILQGLD